MSNKKSVFNNLLSRAQAIYNDWMDTMEYVPTEALKRQIKKSNPKLKDDEIEKLAEKEAQRYFSRNYMKLKLPSAYDTDSPIARIPSRPQTSSPTLLSGKQPLPYGIRN